MASVSTIIFDYKDVLYRLRIDDWYNLMFINRENMMKAFYGRLY